MNIFYWPLYSTRDKETRIKWLLWESDRLKFGFRLGRHLIHSREIYSQNAVGQGHIGLSKHIFLSFLVFSESKLIVENLSSLQNTNCTLNLSNWPLYSRQRNKDKITAMIKGKDSLWLLAGNTLNFFLKYWFSNCSWMGKHSIPSY